MPKISHMLLAALVFVVFGTCTTAEFVGGVPSCPVQKPQEACFGSGENVEWGSVRLPLAETVAYVQAFLQKALEVEHSTIPLYLTTGYSIVNQSSFEAKTIRSVVMEGAPQIKP